VLAVVSGLLWIGVERLTGEKPSLDIFKRLVREAVVEMEIFGVGPGGV